MSETVASRRCARCGESKPATTEFFRVNDKRGYFRGSCIECDRVCGRERRASEPERFREQERQRREADPERYREKQKQDRLAHPERHKEYAKRNKERNGEAILASSRRWYHANKERLNAEDKEQRKARRAEMITAYGGKCDCCGLADDPAFLTLEHIHRDGKAHRAQFKSPEGVYNDLQRRGWPKEGLTLLCWCCQMARAFHGSCPHERGRQLDLLGEVA
jgi:hypothetical protein